MTDMRPTQLKMQCDDSSGERKKEREREREEEKETNYNVVGFILDARAKYFTQRQKHKWK